MADWPVEKNTMNASADCNKSIRLVLLKFCNEI